ncbi:transposase [Streptomyces ureilyticus]|uniref:Transposase n=1 Tax=Streptomyces ureilyticus TaxID=1775131 RepID=A0ABX0DW05_9ACTN|nr:transposase [Streptomyces ureilyticus]
MHCWSNWSPRSCRPAHHGYWASTSSPSARGGYGTVLVDAETSRPVDVLPDRETNSVAAWLHEHRGAEIVCRDRLMAFTKAISQAAPDALQVADRWHLLQNLSTAVEKTCRRHRPCLRKPATPGTEPPPPATGPQDGTPLPTRRPCGTPRLGTRPWPSRDAAFRRCASCRRTVCTRSSGWTGCSWRWRARHRPSGKGLTANAGTAAPPAPAGARARPAPGRAW